MNQVCRYTAQKMKFFTKDLVIFTEEILNGKLHFLCRDGFEKMAVDDTQTAYPLILESRLNVVSGALINIE